MEDKILELCKKVIDGKSPYATCKDIDCFKCPFEDMDCDINSTEIEEIAQNYIKEHEKTVNTIEKIEKNKYKIGDKVKIRYMDPDKYSEPMVDCGGDIATITDIINSQGNIKYRVKENYYYWDEDMLEPVEENEDISRDLIEGNNFTKATVTLKELQEIKNNVDHPKHYTNGKYECIDIIEDVTKDLTGLEAVCTANVIKYMWRWKLKNGVEDLKKARWYLNKLIDNTEIKEIEETYQTEGMAD